MEHDQKPHNTGEKQQSSDPIANAAVSSANMARGFALSAIISGYILGPLLILGGVAWWLHKAGYINKFGVIIAVLVAFGVSNTLIVVRSKKLVADFAKKAGLKDPTPQEAAKWREKNGPYDDDETDEE